MQGDLIVRYKNKLIFAVFFILLSIATFVRVYRTDQILGFYFDQGRDALVVADLLEHHKFFLIGPTTGVAGIFRGPFYYYLISPFYFIGRGNPVFPAVFLELTAVFALLLLFHLGELLFDKETGLIAVFLGTFSFYIVLSSRWLSNPTPMLLLSVLLFYCMTLIQRGKQWAWVPLAFLVGSSQFHFGSSGEFFYYPALFLFALWQLGFFRLKITLPSKNIIIVSVISFGITAAPLVLFDLRHDHILFYNLLKFFGADGSFSQSGNAFVIERINFFVNSFYSKFLLNQSKPYLATMCLVLSLGIVRLPSLIRNVHLRALLLLVSAPFIGFMFFHGNEGNVYDYYLTGYYLFFVLIMALSLRQTLRVPYLGPIIFSVFCILFLQQNIIPLKSTITDGLDGPNTIAFGNERRAVSWVYNNAAGNQFNVDEYVPPVIQYSYQYLFHWYDFSGRGTGHTETMTPLLYTIYEVDPPHPERLEAWLQRQKGIGKVLEEVHFGGITVQKRVRITK